MNRIFSRYYTSKEAMSFAGVSYRRLDYWVRVGIIRASGRPADGPGSLRLFTFRDLVEIRTICTLTAAGLRLNTIRRAVTELRRQIPNFETVGFSSVRLVTDGRKVFKFLKGQQQLESLDGFGQFAFAFKVSDEIEIVRRKVAAISRPVRYIRKAIGDQ